jgi:hypothetical protein
MVGSYFEGERMLCNARQRGLGKNRTSSHENNDKYYEPA